MKPAAKEENKCLANSMLLYYVLDHLSILNGKE